MEPFSPSQYEAAARFAGVYVPEPEDDESDRLITPLQFWGAVFGVVGFTSFLAGVAALVWLASVMMGA